MSRYLSSIFPDDLETFYRLFVYVKRTNGGIEKLSEHLQKEIVQYGRKLFDRYLKIFLSTQRKKQTLWEYIKELAHSMYHLYEVSFFFCCFYSFRPFNSDSTRFPLFSKHCTPPLGPSLIFPSLLISLFLQESLNTSIMQSALKSRKMWIPVEKRTSGSTFSTQLTELIFLYSNISNKVFPPKQCDHRMSLCIATKFFSRVVSSARVPQTARSNGTS